MRELLYSFYKQARKSEMTGAQSHTGDRAGIYAQIYTWNKTNLYDAALAPGSPSIWQFYFTALSSGSKLPL